MSVTCEVNFLTVIGQKVCGQSASRGKVQREEGRSRCISCGVDCSRRSRGIRINNSYFAHFKDQYYISNLSQFAIKYFFLCAYSFASVKWSTPQTLHTVLELLISFTAREVWFLALDACNHAMYHLAGFKMQLNLLVAVADTNRAGVI